MLKNLILKFLDWLLFINYPDIEEDDEVPLFVDEKGKPYFKW
jgi:hypothetical protein